MRKKLTKAGLLKKIKSRTHRIYGIFDFNKNKLTSVNLSKESIELEYDVGCYSPDENKKIVSFDVFLV